MRKKKNTFLIFDSIEKSGQNERGGRKWIENDCKSHAQN